MNRSRYPMENFLGIGIDAVTYSDVISDVTQWIRDKDQRSHHIACVNAYCVTLALSNPRLAGIYNSADIAGPDGMPFVRWIRRQLRVPCDRIAAPDTILALAQHAATTPLTFYLYGGDPEVVVKMRRFLEDRFPHIKIIGHHSPPFRELTPEEDAAICAEVNHLRPDILCVGLGTPKQDYWIDDHLYKIRGSVMVASGATFDFFGGRIKMAPESIRNSGFEWLYRLFSKDFTRLWRRYTIMNLIFLWHFVLQQLRIRVRNPTKVPRSPNMPDSGTASFLGPAT